ncbi:hypothetical protein BDA99DRAFT_537194 [Phascolomyces articulosus]|uniref:Mitochondrial distribution and morphology protein 12 n=1 Tax=Phascolomyces articulosus TaxID=60185 RepID=A0AAD5K047_9FUNG|nr:hypothetical protein BDA99DRAFT_537194 [Phascolomyces articulosus]
MSLDIEWSKLDQELAVHVQHFLNRHFKNIAKPSFIGDIEVTAFEWGTESPSIEITNITDPFPEFYEEEDPNPEDEENDDEDDDDNDNSNNNATNTTPVSTTGRSTTGTPSIAGSGLNRLQPSSTTSADNLLNTSNNSIASSASSNNLRNRRPISMPPTSPPVLPSGLMSPSSEPFARFATPGTATPQHRFNLGHSFHRSPFVAPQHPFHASYYHSPPQYFPSPTTPPEPSWRTNTTGGTIPEDWIDDDEMLPTMAAANASVNSSGQSIQQQQPLPNASTTTTGAGTTTQNPQLNRPSTEMDFQTSMLISYKGDMSMTLLTELRMNYPSMMFMSLPIQLRVKSVEFEATAIVAYIKSMDRVCVSMLEPEQSEEHVLRGREVSLESLLREVQIESVVGDKQKQVLKNVGKVEKFIVDQLRKMLDDELVFPSYQCIQLD